MSDLGRTIAWDLERFLRYNEIPPTPERRMYLDKWVSMGYVVDNGPNTYNKPDGPKCACGRGIRRQYYIKNLVTNQVAVVSWGCLERLLQFEV